MLKAILIIAGTISLCLGIIGIFVPGLPTTPFLVLTAGCYIRSSQKLYQLVTGNKYLGSYIKEFQIKKGMAIKTKIYSISVMWVMIIISITLFISIGLVKVIIAGVGLIGTLVMGFIIPTKDNLKK